jgi:hypothetical protein
MAKKAKPGKKSTSVKIKKCSPCHGAKKMARKGK